MRVSVVQLHHIRIPFKAAVHHSLKRRQETEAVIVAIGSDEGRIGFGEILPRPYLTGETVESVLRDLGPALAGRWLGRSLSAKQAVFEALCQELEAAGRSLATFAGFELALLDLTGQTYKFPAGEILERPAGPELGAGAVIDFNVPTGALSKLCAQLRLLGRCYIKVKVGLPDDLRRLQVIRKSLGPDARLSVDANAAWSADEAIEALLPMRQFDLRSVEQPVPAPDLAGMRRVRERTGLPVVADESLCTLEDGRRLIEEGAADIFNIRLGKCGGFLGSLRLVKLAEEAGLRCHLGTLVGETGILSRATEIFGCHVNGFECLEGKGMNRSLLVEDIIEPRQGDRTSCPGEGLGIRAAADRLVRWAASDPIVFETAKGALA